MSQKGPVRTMLATLTRMSRFSGLTLEQTADFLDALSKDQSEGPEPTSSTGAEPISKTVQ